MDTCDKYMVGWAYWEFKKFMDITTSAGSTSEGFYENDGTLQTKKVKALTRSYMKSAQGTPLSMNFNSTSGEFTATYELDHSIKAPTVIYKSDDFYYQDGYTVEVYNDYGIDLMEQNSVSVTQSDIPHHLNIQVNDVLQHAVPITVKITPKTASAELIQ